MYLLSLYHISVFYAIYPSGATTIVQLPLAFVRSGNINTGDGKVYFVGERGYVWTRMIVSSAVARSSSFNTTDVSATGSNNRYNGFSLR